MKLRQRYERARQADEEGNMEWDRVDDVEQNTGSEVMMDALVEDSSVRKVKIFKGQFGRRRTHNEQLIIAPCGIILARETFYHSEAFSAVAVSFSTFRFRSNTH
jgi:hypothetical protein